MTSHARRIPAALLCLASLALTAATCSPDPAPDPDAESSASQSASSIFDGPSVKVAVKKGQPGFNTRSGEEYEYAGFETDLLNSLADEIPFKEYAQDIPSLKREEILRDEGADLVIATYTITEARDEKVDFTAPYMKTYQGVLVRKDEDRIKKLDDLKGMKVCSASGSTSDPGSVESEEAKEAIRNGLGVGVDPGLRKDYKTCVKELAKGNFDAVWTDKIVLEGFAHQAPYDKDVKMLEDITIGQRQLYGIGLREGHEADCRKLNKALKKFLDTRWRLTFQQHFPALAEGDFEQKYKPSDAEFEDYRATSCGGR
ncbi:transporter substrate-binding domain-containing protein [Streptomyces albidus (ex Kaewkla and Franco 2022)]|uniref:transporter substrate-binding domain-containing protein n=1 Tax=Streptomyces albidus (ex Kaewkla and Franco 2022) TaxID=722709 RepID=UPI0015EF0C77|nr:transporter substrate-binding domain-containing protein [Streptomyces albidus (ex Kaewkla and Franco 2022)]